jgi:hypothetical protein
MRSRRSRFITLTILAASIAAACGRDAGWDAAIEGGQKPEGQLEAGIRTQREAQEKLMELGALPEGASEKIILFGDLHVHTSYSWDGFLFSLPLVGGEGAHPPNDACDFARHCANLDFFALTDHAESLLPAHWESSKESVRQCNAIAGDPRNPDLVAFMGFEWSQTGPTPEGHFGHRCVIFPETADESLPARPIAASDQSPVYLAMRDMVRGARWLQPQAWAANTSYVEYLETVSARPLCPEGIASRELPQDCQELAPTPRELHAKLDEWGLEVLTIPHGTTWGIYTPVCPHLSRAHPGLSSLLLAGRRDHALALRRPDRGGVRTTGGACASVRCGGLHAPAPDLSGCCCGGVA